MLGIGLVLFLALRARLASLSVAVLTYCLLVGMVASLVEAFSGMLLGRLRRPGVPPRWLALSFTGLPGSPRLLLLELFLVQVQSGCVSWPSVPFILRLPGLLGDCGFADV